MEIDEWSKSSRREQLHCRQQNDDLFRCVQDIASRPEAFAAPGILFERTSAHSFFDSASKMQSISSIYNATGTDL